MSASEGHHQASYQVIVLGELRPAVLAFCARPPMHISTSGVLQLRVREGQGIAELAAMLQAAGLMIQSIRQLTPPEGMTTASLHA
jgi:hypothetical protein